MIERHSINGKEVWIRIERHPAYRQNPNVIPTEYFTAIWFLQEPAEGVQGETITEDGEARLFESPVAALSQARKLLETKLSS